VNICWHDTTHGVHWRSRHLVGRMGVGEVGDGWSSESIQGAATRMNCQLHNFGCCSTTLGVAAFHRNDSMHCSPGREPVALCHMTRPGQELRGLANCKQRAAVGTPGSLPGDTSQSLQPLPPQPRPFPCGVAPAPQLQLQVQQLSCCMWQSKHQLTVWCKYCAAAQYHPGQRRGAVTTQLAYLHSLFCSHISLKPYVLPARHCLLKQLQPPSPPTLSMGSKTTDVAAVAGAGHAGHRRYA
jgi:hypothetical protein